MAEITYKQQNMQPLAFDKALAAIAVLEANLIAKGEAIDLFARNPLMIFI
ncbi:hypothetical protein N5094_02195 [Shewanella putrefaciens]|nr:hypothetical protein [Shewanella putrefaciens]UXK09068.1 hypothetical protein N5094_02195 [Shewanella putrefaciens]SUI81874.1 Uncharacterised protein [Shewanella putrefaciens]